MVAAEWMRDALKVMHGAKPVASVHVSFFNIRPIINLNILKLITNCRNIIFMHVALNLILKITLLLCSAIEAVDL
jgi:hypothetical protein